MIQLPPHVRVYQYVDPVDFRNGIDGLAGLCRSKLRQDPTSGSLFLFINRRRTAFKGLIFDGQGFWLFQKRFSQGRIRFWPSGTDGLTALQVQVLLYNGHPQGSDFAPDWKPVGRNQ